jgi:hypothetical protein
MVRVCSLKLIFDQDRTNVVTYFIWRLVLYMLMSFGLTNAVTYFMDLMNKVFMEYLDKFIDGILVYSKSEEEHEEHLRLVLRNLRDHRLYAKFSKCMVWMKQEFFLSHAILEEGMPMDSSKILDMSSWNVPVSVADIHSIL